MAGVTTASRAGWGIIASSEEMNPKTQGDYFNSTTNASANYSISSIPTTEWRDLEIWLNKSNQNTWTAPWYFYFNGVPSHTTSTYWYTCLLYTSPSPRDRG